MTKREAAEAMLSGKVLIDEEGSEAFFDENEGFLFRDDEFSDGITMYEGWLNHWQIKEEPERIKNLELWCTCEKQKAQGIKPVVIRITDGMGWLPIWEFTYSKSSEIADIESYPDGTVNITNIRKLEPEDK